MEAVPPGSRLIEARLMENVLLIFIVAFLVISLILAAAYE